eukprot:s3590_g7.t1
MGAVDADPDSVKKKEPLRVKALADGSAVETPEGSVEGLGRCGPELLVHFRKWHLMWFLVLGVSVCTLAVLFRAMEFGFAALKPVVPEPCSVPVVSGAAIAVSIFLCVMTLEWCKLLRFITSVAWWLLGVLKTRARCGAGSESLTEWAASAKSHPESSRKQARMPLWAGAGVLKECEIGCAGVLPFL